MSSMDRNTGRLLTLPESVSQAIGDILTTRVGSRLERENYGSLLPELIDNPLNSTTLMRVKAATAIAIMRWEPRFKITRVQLLQNAHALEVEITGSINSQPLTVNTPIGAR